MYIRLSRYVNELTVVSVTYDSVCYQIAYRVFAVDVIAALLDQPERSYGILYFLHFFFLLNYSTLKFKVKKMPSTSVTLQ